MNKYGTDANDKIVIVAGAGISKQAPSSLPSWWDYNRILIDMIGEVATEGLGLQTNPIDANRILSSFNVTTVSEFFVDRIAGDAYFPLLSLLDGARPNENHLTLAGLAKNDTISAIVTTNFDTLIEKAFDASGVPYKVFVSPNDYATPNQGGFPIYKIHGSTNSTDFAIDTVRQKLIGLTEEKKDALKKLFSTNRVIFMGFSGEDFLFGSDYIPVASCKKGIVWISHPGSTFNKRTKGIIKELNIVVREMELRSFFLESGWDVPNVPDGDDDSSQFEDKAREAMRSLLLSFGPETCGGLCLELLDLSGDIADADRLMDKLLANEKVDSLEADIPLLSQIARRYRNKGDYEKSKEICLRQLELFERRFKFIKWVYTGHAIEDELMTALALNKSTMLDNLALSYLMLQEYDHATDCLVQAFKASFVARNWGNTANTLFLLALVKQNQLDSFNEVSVKDRLLCFYTLAAAMNVAKRGGSATRIVEIGVKLAAYYEEWGMQHEFREVKKDVDQALPIAFTDGADVASAMNALEASIQGKSNNELDPIEMCQHLDVSDNWEHYGQRPLLCYEEGRSAKEIHASHSIAELIEYMEKVIENSISDGRLDLADAMLDSEIGVILERSNQNLIDGLEIKWYEDRSRVIELLEKSITIELKLNRVDRLAQTLGMMAQLFSYDPDCKVDQGIFLAELVLCIGFDERYNWRMCHAAIMAASLSFRSNLFAQSKRYCERFFEIMRNNPNATEEANIKYMNELYAQLTEK